MDYTNLIVSLINVAPGLVTALENWFQNNPRQVIDGQPETDEQYAARIMADALKMAQDTTAIDSQVSGS